MESAVSKKRETGCSSTRTTILDVATRLFARQGYDRVTMRDISSAVGVSMPTIYHHFKDKECLYREVELANYGAMKARLLSSISASASPRDQLYAFVAELYDVFNEDPIFLGLAVRNMLDPDERHHKFLVGVAMQDVYDAFSRLIGELDSGKDTRMTPLIVISSILGFIMMGPAKRLIEGYPHRAGDNVDERADFIEYIVKSMTGEIA
ncbi:MAG: helix-turn-helix domain-containing protein [Porticoccaceae bacterium]